MAEQSTRSRFTGDEVLALLEEEEDGMDENFFPGSDEDLALNSDEDNSDAGEDEENGDAGEDEEDSTAGRKK